MKRHPISQTLLALLAAFALLVTACASSDNDIAASTDTRPDDSADTDDSGSDDSGDAEAEFDSGQITSSNDGSADEVATDDSSGDEDAMQDDAMEEGGATTSESVDSSDADADRAAEAPAPVDSGLFESTDIVEPEPQPTAQAERDDFFENYGVRDFVQTNNDPLSTFALDVDTGAYSVTRRYLNEGSLPPTAAVRVEEFVNSFDYGYDDPRGDDLGITIDGGPSPFDNDTYLVRIGVQSLRIDDEDRPAASLTFVIDTSGSMRTDGRLELVQDALEELVEELDEDDTVAIVEFDDNPSIVLEPTSVDDQGAILDAIDRLRPGGSTNVEGGLELGYQLANQAYRSDGVNRVILLSDGVANVGLTDPDALSRMIRDDADEGIQLLTIGVGLGDFNDTLMEQLADQGDGFYAYVDTKDEAERLFEDRLTSTLVTMAIDAKIQVEWDEDIVDRYRLIGFENRGVLDSDFRNNDVDAGEIGAGHQVTAIYEVELQRGVSLSDSDELGEVSLRWEEPGTGDITEITEDIDLRDIEADWDDTSESFQLATVVTVFAEILRASPFADDIDLDDLSDEAESLADRMGNRDVDELADLIAIADRLS